MKIALGQINTTVGATSANVEKMVEYAQKARVAGAELIAFHELCIPGYPPKELVERRDFVSANLKAIDRLKEQCRGIGVVCGYIDREAQSRSSEIYNAAGLFDAGRILLSHRKSVLSAFTGFDERVHFAPGRRGAVADFRGLRIALAISEDVWTDKDFWEKRTKPRILPGRLVREGARMVIVLSSSPFWPGKHRERERAAKALALKYGVPVIYINQAGCNDSLVFDGGSFAVSADGKILGRAKRFEEDLLIVDTEAAGKDEPAQHDDVEDVRRALVLGVRDFVRKCGFKKVVLGLSGGIDSALVACIAVEALGRENVLALLLPSMYTPAESLRDAELVAENLGIERRTVSIEPLYHAYMQMLRKDFEGLPEDITEENIQARIRANILMAFANKFRQLVLATGNRSEAMTGYCTLYGDAAGGLAVIADISKEMVYQVAERFNAARPEEVIPRSVFDRAPSAELKPNQKDSDTLPPYTVLDPILAALLDEEKTPQETVALGYDEHTVRYVVRRIYGSEHKRKQSPPVLFISRSALAPGRTRPIVMRKEDAV